MELCESCGIEWNMRVECQSCGKAVCKYCLCDEDMCIECGEESGIL